LGFDDTVASPVWLPQLAVEAVRWKRPLTAGATLATRSLGTQIFPKTNELEFRFQRAGLDWLTAESAGSQREAAANAPVSWPVFEGTMRTGESLKNPLLFPEKLRKPDASFVAAVKALKGYSERQTTPLLQAYPWLMALALLFVTIEQLLSRLAPRSNMDH
jgi:hypothetical protein